MAFSQNEKSVTEYAKSITPNELKELLYVYASDYFEGRETGTRGQKKAVDFIRQFYTTHAINAAKGTENYFQPMELNIKGKMVKTENVVAIIEGNEYPNEYIVISSHLDHVGIQKGMIHNGADDDGSGSVAMLEIAEAFQEAAAAGQGPKRSIIFLHVTGEEKGLLGSKYYTQNPLYPLEDTMTNLNVDMIGRLDPKRVDKDPNYIYLIGADKISQELHDISEATNKKYTQIKLDYTYNDDKDPNRFYYRSDHYNFAKNNIPVIFYFNGTHEDYHAPGDTPDKINYDMLAKRSQLIFHTAWELANRKDKIKIN
jgi:Zn-dependent M28 family amino/carboxypeptidase